MRMVLAVAAVVLGGPAMAQCAGGDWQCQHNEFHNRMMDNAARGPSVLDWLNYFSQQSTADAEREERARQRSVKVDAIKQALGAFDTLDQPSRTTMCREVYPAALNNGLLDIKMSREFWNKCTR
jgi:hypothetical protein